jgi:hypothetical protein
MRNALEERMPEPIVHHAQRMLFGQQARQGAGA